MGRRLYRLPTRTILQLRLRPPPHRLTAQGTSSYVYDGVGNRIKATRSGVVTKYVYDAAGNLLAEANSSNVITRYYIYGHGLTAMVDAQTNALYVYHFDGTGHTVALTNAAQQTVNTYAYDPYGRIMAQTETVAQPFKYAGQVGIVDEGSNLYYMRARYYNANIGRFISEDPIGFQGGLNLYAYVGGNPVNRIDPNGLLTEVLVFQGVGAGASSQGHVAVNINGTSYSWGPGGMAIETTGQYLDRNNFRSAIGRTLDISPLQEILIRTDLQNFSKGNSYNPVTCNCTDPIETSLEHLGYDLGYNITPNSLAYSLDSSGIVKSVSLYPASAKANGYTAPYASTLPVPAK